MLVVGVMPIGSNYQGDPDRFCEEAQEVEGLSRPSGVSTLGIETGEAEHRVVVCSWRGPE